MASHGGKAPAVLLATAALLAAAAVAMALAASSLHDRAALTAPSPETARTEDSDGFPEVDWGHWLSVNPDVVGWITIPGTDVDGPIVQAPQDDPDYYLTHDVQKTPNFYGCFYLDAECAGDGWASRNAVVSGHHMDDGSMFADVASYADPEWAAAHREILLQTPDSKRRLEVRFAQSVSSEARAKRTSFEGEGDWLAWYAGSLDGACTVLDADTRPESAVTLVTCSHSYATDERTVVVAAPTTPHRAGDVTGKEEI